MPRPVSSGGAASGTSEPAAEGGQGMTTHLETSLQQDLDLMRSKVVEMGHMAERAVRRSIRAVIEHDRQQAFAVILRDRYIDEIEKQLDRMCLNFLVRHQPAASLLRFAYSTIKVNLELERVGDYAEGIAREALRLTSIDAPLPLDRLQQIVDLAVPMLHDAIEAFVGQDADLARRTIESDEAVDLLRDKLTADVTQSFRDGSLPFEALYPLVMVARRLERVSDQARNIGMETLYLCTGEIAKHPGSTLLRVLFVDRHHACRSLIAEHIGNTLKEEDFEFSSAGLDPMPVEPETATFMASKGFDVRRTIPRALTDVENLEAQDVIVLLDREARRAFPRRPRKAVLLEWPVADPSQERSDPEAAREAYQSTYDYLDSQIRDLVSAIRDSNRV
ncbi:MAG: phosphate signaling complex protein PhoU [Acidobacteriota bacterium]